MGYNRCTTDSATWVNVFPLWSEKHHSFNETWRRAPRSILNIRSQKNLRYAPGRPNSGYQ